MKHLILIPLLLTQLITAPAQGQKISPKPNNPIPKVIIEKIMGDWKGAKLNKDVSILWLTGPEDHKGGEHDYIRIKELFVPMLRSIPRVKVQVAFNFPTQEQFDQTDLLIQYLHLPDLSDAQLAMYQKFVDQGGRVVSIHESCIMRPVERAEKLAGCIGCSWKGNKVSKWGKFGTEYRLHLDNQHPVFKGMPYSLQLNDESYWNLLTRDNVEVVGAIAPNSKFADSFKELLKLPEVRSQAFWTYKSGKGKVFGTTTGHYTYTFYDPLYRLILIRGIAWTLDVDPAPFMPLVLHGITDKDGNVGTTDTMMDYKNRKAME